MKRGAYWYVLVVIAILGVGGGAAYTSLRGVSGGETPGRKGAPDLPDTARAGSVVHYTSETFLNYDYRPGREIPFAATQGHLFTERWVELGPDGRVTRFKDITRLPDGTLWQERLYEDGRIRVNWYQRPGDGASCPMVLVTTPSGSSLPTPDMGSLQAAGFKRRPAARPADLRAARMTPAANWTILEKGGDRQPPPGVTRTRKVVLVDGTGELRADLTIGELADGSEVVLESDTWTPFDIVGGDVSGTFQQTDLPPCSGGGPVPNPSPSKSGGGDGIPTPPPAQLPGR